MRPVDVSVHTQTKAWENLYGKRWPGYTKGKGETRYKFQVGDRVCISRLKGTFEKGYMPNWSTELFTVADRRDREPPVYKIRDDRGEVIESVFYEPELLRIYG
jgi:hypothetical protein